MWKKEEVPAPTPAPQTDAPRTDRRSAAPADRATIGRSITIRGEVTGDEDLLIQGRVDGSVNLKQHSVTVGPEGEVTASITARVVTIEGTVEGDLSAEEQVILRSSASVQGDIIAPRVVLEDGARFRGGIDMGDVGTTRRGNNASPSESPKPEPSASGGSSGGDRAKSGTEKAAEATA